MLWKHASKHLEVKDFDSMQNAIVGLLRLKKHFSLYKNNLYIG